MNEKQYKRIVRTKNKGISRVASVLNVVRKMHPDNSALYKADKSFHRLVIHMRALMKELQSKEESNLGFDFDAAFKEGDTVPEGLFYDLFMD